MNDIFVPLINDLSNKKLNFLLDEFVKNYSLSSSPEMIELVNKERYPIRIHIQDAPKKTESAKAHVQRGRKKNNTCKLEDLDVNKYVQAVVLQVENEQYLLDQHNLLYKFNSVNEIVGHIVNHEIQWF